MLNPLMLDLQKRIINQAIGRRNFEALLWLCGAFLGAVLLNGALKYVKQNMEGYISETMLRDLRGELYNRILRFPLLHLKNTSTGQLVAMILGEVEDLGGYFGVALSTPAFHVKGSKWKEVTRTRTGHSLDSGAAHSHDHGHSHSHGGHSHTHGPGCGHKH